jgi:signal transduction histidine kinase
MLVFGVEVAIGMCVLRDLLVSSVEVQKTYDVSVRGLRRIGELQYEAQETRRSTLFALTTSNPNLQVKYADQSRAAVRLVTADIARYVHQAKEPREIELGEHLARDWAAYLGMRDEELGSILEGGVKEAVNLDLSAGAPAFDRVRQDLVEINRLYDERALRQVERVANSSRRSAVRLIGGLGFALLLGNAAIWAIERNKVRSTLELARLQMDFVASVSHELRTPITAILSAGENIRDGLVDTREILQEQGSILTGQATLLMDMVDEVLQFATSGERKPWHTFRPIDVGELVDHALQSSSAVLQQAGFTVEREVQPELPRVVGDLTALSQCLQNLIANAVKYSNGSRWIAISARSEQAGSEGAEVLISVEDHGLGIPAEEQLHIFEPFYRGPQVVAQVRGTGLGLSIAKRSAELCGGRVTVVSKVGAGSVFTVHLPVPPEERQLVTGSHRVGGEFAS